MCSKGPHERGNYVFIFLVLNSKKKTGRSSRRRYVTFLKFEVRNTSQNGQLLTLNLFAGNPKVQGNDFTKNKTRILCKSPKIVPDIFGDTRSWADGENGERGGVKVRNTRLNFLFTKTINSYDENKIQMGWARIRERQGRKP